MHLDDRISMEPGTPARGEKVRLEYRGLLANSGADSVWLHCGYDGWNKVSDIPMSRSAYGNFACTAEVQGSKEMNFCFKDSANNWDNNNGWNWSVSVK
jgi:hypothetical protein